MLGELDELNCSIGILKAKLNEYSRSEKKYLRFVGILIDIQHDLFNIGGEINNSISLKDLTIKCEQLTKNKIKFKSVSKTSLFDIPYYVSDNSKLIKFYKWKPSRNIDKILMDIYNWLTKNKIIRNYFL